MMRGAYMIIMMGMYAYKLQLYKQIHMIGAADSDSCDMVEKMLCDVVFYLK